MTDIAYESCGIVSRVDHASWPMREREAGCSCSDCYVVCCIFLSRHPHFLVLGYSHAVEVQWSSHLVIFLKGRFCQGQ